MGAPTFSALRERVFFVGEGCVACTKGKSFLIIFQEYHLTKIEEREMDPAGDVTSVTPHAVKGQCPTIKTK